MKCVGVFFLGLLLFLTLVGDVGAVSISPSSLPTCSVGTKTWKCFDNDDKEFVGVIGRMNCELDTTQASCPVPCDSGYWSYYGTWVCTDRNYKYRCRFEGFSAGPSPCNPASSSNPWWSTTAVSSIGGACGSDVGTCVNFSAGECGTSATGCGNSNACCSMSGLTAWHKYNVSCSISFSGDYNWYFYGYNAVVSADSCSIGDKCLETIHQADGGNTSATDQKETAARVAGDPSGCTCVSDYGRQYKLCCGNTSSNPYAGPVQCVRVGVMVKILRKEVVQVVI